MTKSSKIAVLGAGGHALSVLDAAASAGFEPYAIVDSHSTRSQLFGLPVMPDLSGLDLSEIVVCLGIGHNFVREAVFAETRKAFPEASFPVIRHATAWVSSTAKLGEGSVVLAHASVGPSAKTGIGVLLNTGSSLDHGSILDNFASLGPGARTGGDVTIGARTMIGLNAGVLQGVSVAHDAVVGAHSLANRDIRAFVVAYGVPCAPVRERNQTEPYY